MTKELKALEKLKIELGYYDHDIGLSTVEYLNIIEAALKKSVKTYIRTCDNIIDLSKVTIGGEFGWESIEEYITFKQDRQSEPIIQADNIEELLDGYIIKDKDDELPYTTKNITKFDYLNNIDKDNFIIYGAIWVPSPRGGFRLEPVAQLNKSGEWELL